MAPRKKADDKSLPLAAAAVGAGTELVQAQTEQKQGAGPVGQAAEAAAAAATTQNTGDQGGTNAIGASSSPGANLSAAMASDLPDWLLGQFDVKAKSPAGFWRCGIHFLHSGVTRVFVVTAKADVPHDHDCEIPCCYLTPEDAQRVHQESWLTVVPDSEVTKD
ncbi:hypothetical protein E5E97_21695 [Aeromonas sp. 2692-1]|uniref:hypothetical protein n=1 Tax=Aeromonas sp. 2692-1 TaxID=2560029 RepID=UPI00148B2810|nr:hypothetical protein [Aeromonas sp. 2692-1]QJT15259.1 hypothetical protein E5E97_21695 [Aeromonas sp. 2692-1]